MNFNQPVKLIITLGIVLVAIGLVMSIGGKLGLGKLPGDIIIKRENFTFYFPIVTCIAASVILTVIMWIIRGITGR